jgi:hypothetical protein
MEPGTCERIQGPQVCPCLRAETSPVEQHDARFASRFRSCLQVVNPAVLEADRACRHRRLLRIGNGGPATGKGQQEEKGEIAGCAHWSMLMGLVHRLPDQSSKGGSCVAGAEGEVM